MRKNVRKLEALLLAGAMAVTTAGCMPTSKSQDSAGGQSAQESSTAQNTGETAAAIKIAVMFIFVSSFYSNPENPKNAIAIRPAVTSTIGDPWKLYGISFPSIRSRIPARSTIETV